MTMFADDGLLRTIRHGGMLITDVVVERQFGVQPAAVKIGVEIFGALLVVVLGRWLASRKTASKESVHESA